MRTVTVHATMDVPVENGRSSISLQAGRAYVMHDIEVASGQDAGAFEQVSAAPAGPRCFKPDGRLTGRMVVPFIGGMGDAISLLPALNSLRQQHVGLRIEVATTAGPAEVFNLATCVNKVVGYPLAVTDWKNYDHYLCLELVHQTSQKPGRPLQAVFAEALGIELTHKAIELKLPRVTEAAAEPSGVPLVGIAVGEGRSLRSYPSSMLRELVSLLVRHGLGCVLLGHADPAWNIPVCPPVITDMRSRTPTVLDLAVWLRAVDVVVSHDSFIMHLAGALGRPSVGLFAPTSRSHATPYAGTVPLAAAAECSPCHAVGSTCPRGLDRCVAWDDHAVRATAVADAVFERLNSQGRRMPSEGSGIAIAL